MRCINIDWLSVFGKCDYNLIKQSSLPNYMRLFDNERGTPLFKKWYTIYSYENFKIAEICFDPFSLKIEGGIYEVGACTIQICNRYCYDIRLFDILEELSNSINFVLKSISRVDICCDFFLFDNGMKPKTLINGYYSGKFLKVGFSKALGVGEQFNDYNPQTLSFKGKGSAISFKLYNKSKEMEDKKLKRYIQDAWVKCGLVDADVWRLEVSIKSDGREVVQLSTGEITKIGISQLKDKDILSDIFISYVNSKFRWLRAKKGVRRDRLEELSLFSSSKNKEIYKPVKVTSARDYGKRSKMIMNAIAEMLEDTSIDPKMRLDMQMAAFHMSTYYRCDINNLFNSLKNEKK